MFEFFGSVASALADVGAGAKNIGEILDGGKKIYDFAAGVFDWIGRRIPGKQQPAVIRETLTQAASMPLPGFELKMRDVVEQAIPDSPPEFRKQVTEYLTLMPAKIRQTFARVEDPTGKTVPANWTVQRPDDLIPRGRRCSAGRLAARGQPLGSGRTVGNRRLRRGLEGPRQDDAEQLHGFQILPRPEVATVLPRERIAARGTDQE